MPKVSTTRILSEFRKLFNSKHTTIPIDAYLIFSMDIHMSEYTSDWDKRREFISGFKGSAGSAVVTKDEALLWTDGRYYLEAEASLDENWKLMKSSLSQTPTILEWLKKLPTGYVIGIDPRYVTYGNYKLFNRELKRTGKSLEATDDNLVDVVWQDHGKREQVLSKPYVYGLQFAGMTWQDKVSMIRERMCTKHAQMVVLNALDEIAWLFNLRGSDIHCCPVFKSFSIITLDSLYLFIDDDRITPEVASHLNRDGKAPGESVIIKPYFEIQFNIKELAKNIETVWINSQTTAVLVLCIPKKKIILDTNPVTICKAVKNKVEIDNFKEACVRDAACLCEFFGFIEKNVKTRQINEVEAADILTSIRSKMVNYVMNSFDTISSVGSNAAIIHYRPTEETAKIIDDKQIYLCDSGANYLDGTTDITRTLHFGTPTDYERECYTLVLQGHISLASMIFPKGTKGNQLDSFARQKLWSSGLDYTHGTGHGIGMFLNVHEGPQGISSSSHTEAKLEIGNVLSNEPGYYQDHEFGIRIESMMSVVPATAKYNYNGEGSLGFQMLSFIPMHMPLIKQEMLSKEEKIWLNKYHAECRSLIQPALHRLGFKDGVDYLTKNSQELIIN